MSRQPLEIHVMNDRCLKSLHTYLQTTSFLLVFMSLYIELGLRLLHIWLRLDNTTVSFVGWMHSMERENEKNYSLVGIITQISRSYPPTP
jgi:hypothetical protein